MVNNNNSIVKPELMSTQLLHPLHPYCSYHRQSRHHRASHTVPTAVDGAAAAIVCGDFARRRAAIELH